MIIFNRLSQLLLKQPQKMQTRVFVQSHGRDPFALKGEHLWLTAEQISHNQYRLTLQRIAAIDFTGLTPQPHLPFVPQTYLDFSSTLQTLAAFENQLALQKNCRVKQGALPAHHFSHYQPEHIAA